MLPVAGNKITRVENRRLCRRDGEHHGDLGSRRDEHSIKRNQLNVWSQHRRVHKRCVHLHNLVSCNAARVRDVHGHRDGLARINGVCYTKR